MAVIGREAARAPLTSADINDGIVGAADLQSTLDLSSKTITMPSISSLDVTGNLTVDTSTLYVDATNNRVGIGTTSPATRLELSGVKDTSELRLSSTTNDSSWVVGEYFGKLSFYSADSSGAGAGVKGSIVTAQSGSSGATPYMTFNVASTSTNDVERMRLDASGNLLVGVDTNTTTTSAEGFVYNNGGSLLVTRDGAPSAYFTRLTSDGDVAVFRKDGTTVGMIQSRAGLVSNIILDARTPTSTAGAGLGTSVAAICPADTSGLTDAKNDLGINTNRFKDLYLSGGAYLGGTGAANLLDDYETGGWTPEIADAASGGNTGSATASRVIYTKVGRLVTVSAQLLNVDTTGMTAGSQLYIRGLPFASASANIAFGSIQTDNLTFRTSRTQILPMIVASDSFLTIKNIGDGLSDLTTLVSDVSSGTTDIYFSITYQAA